MNDVARTVLRESKPLTYPEGTVIVREKLPTESGPPEVLTAMIKRKKGFNPKANDWEFLLLSGDATEIKKREKTGACQQCHASAKEKDFVIQSYSHAPLPVSSAGTPK